MVSALDTTDQNNEVRPGCGRRLHTKTAISTVRVDRQEQKQSFDNNSMEPVCGLMPVAVRNGERLSDADPVADWMGEIKKAWARDASGTLDLPRVVSAAKNRLQRQYGQWSQFRWPNQFRRHHRCRQFPNQPG